MAHELTPHDIPLEEIYSDDQFNCRGRIAPIDVVDLARSIDEIGLQQAIVVQPYSHPDRPKIKYRIVSGHRRFRAFQVLERDTIPSVIRAGLSDLEARKFNLEENLKRKGLNILQEANALMPFRLAGMIHDDIARYLGVSRGWVQVRVALLDLPGEIQQEAAAGFLTQEQIKGLTGLPKDKQYEMVKKIKTAKLSGESISKFRVKPVKRNPLARRARQRDEVFEMQNVVQDVIGNNFATRCLAWAAGEISSFELLRDLKELAKEKGLHYEIPREIMLAVAP